MRFSFQLEPSESKCGIGVIGRAASTDTRLIPVVFCPFLDANKVHAVNETCRGRMHLMAVVHRLFSGHVPLYVSLLSSIIGPDNMCWCVPSDHLYELLIDFPCPRYWCDKCDDQYMETPREHSRRRHETTTTICFSGDYSRTRINRVDGGLWKCPKCHKTFEGCSRRIQVSLSDTVRIRS